MLVKSTPGIFGNQPRFHQQYCAKLYQYTQLDAMTNFYPIHSTTFASKVSVNLLAQKLAIEC